MPKCREEGAPRTTRAIRCSPATTLGSTNSGARTSDERRVLRNPQLRYGQEGPRLARGKGRRLRLSRLQEGRRRSGKARSVERRRWLGGAAQPSGNHLPQLERGRQG